VPWKPLQTAPRAQLKPIRNLPESLLCRGPQARAKSRRCADCAYEIRKLAPKEQAVAKPREAMFSWSVLWTHTRLQRSLT